jgi:hypothetical protein
LLESLLTVAENCCMPFTGTLAEAGDTETANARTVMVAEADAEGSTTEVAVSVTARLLDGGGVGAV